MGVLDASGMVFRTLVQSVNLVSMVQWSLF
jgi:hypothetical protein